VINLSVGNDNGNSEHAMIINGILTLQPNVNCKVNSNPWIDENEQSTKLLIKNLPEQLVVDINSQAIKSSGLYYVGKFALSSGEIVNNMQVGVENKAYSDLPIINTLAKIAEFVVRNTYERKNKIPTKIEVNVDMTTSLPVTQYDKETASYFESKFMDYTHEVNLYLGYRQIAVTIKFSYVKALPEATPVTFAIQKNIDETWRSGSIFDDFYDNYMNELPNEFNGSYFKNKKILHVDIGDGTTEYPVTEDNIFLRQFIYGSNHGVGHAIEESLGEFNKVIHVPDSPRQFLSDVIKNPNHKYYEKAMNILQRPLEIQAQQIIKNIQKQFIKTRNELDILCVYGGGSIIMRDFLYDQLMELCQEREIKLLYVPDDYATTLNVEGLDIFCRGKIFQALKEKFLSK